jgi:uncharacterized surface protein with fasciclin (FAS1) repeats
LILPLLAAVLATTLTGATAPAMARPESDRPSRDLVETAAEAGSFNTLAKALQAGGLVEALKGPGPFTVFAPTDEAFAALPEGTVEELLMPENLPTLRRILSYHIVPGTVTASDLMGDQTAAMTMALDYLWINGVTRNGVFIDTSDSYPSPNPVQVVEPDIMADNGVIHVIDGVLLP